MVDTVDQQTVPTCVTIQQHTQKRLDEGAQAELPVDTQENTQELNSMPPPQCPLPQEQSDDAAQAAAELLRQEEEMEASEWHNQWHNQEAHYPCSPVTAMPATEQTVAVPDGRTAGGSRQDPAPWNPGQRHPPQLVPAPSEIVLTARQRKRIRQTERKLNGAKRFAIEQEQARTAEIAVRRHGFHYRAVQL